MGVLDGQAIDAAVTNAAFLDKNIDTIMPNKLGLNRPASGTAIADIQATANKLYAATGASELVSGTVYNATPSTITNGESHQDALVGLANKFDPATGHMHTGAPGDGPVIGYVHTIAASGNPPLSGDIIFIPGPGISISETGQNIVFTSSSSAGVNTIAASGNPPLSGDVELVAGANISLSESGQQITINSMGGGGGSKNYLSALTTSNGSNNGNGNFELGNTIGWSLANVATVGVIPSATATPGTAFDATHGGTAANVDLSLSVLSSGQIAGLHSASLAFSGPNAVTGDLLISNAFNIDSEDQAKVMTVKFYYEAASGASNINFSGTSDNTFAIWIYDVTNGAWIMPAGVYDMVQGSGAGYATATFQTTINSTQYQLALITIGSSAGPFALTLDDFSVGPQTAPMGPAMSDWQSYTPTFGTGLGTITGPNFFYRRVGDSLQVMGNFTNGTVAASYASISLPSGYNVDPAKLPTPGAVSNIIGTWAHQGSAVEYGNLLTLSTSPGATSTNEIYFGTSTTGAQMLVPQYGNSIMSSGDVVSVTFQVPIAGWSSNCQMSNDTDTRVVQATYGLAGEVYLLNGSSTTIIYDTKVNDTHAAFNTSTGIYTIPVSGVYRISAGTQFININNTGVRQVTVVANSNGYLLAFAGTSTEGSGQAPFLTGSIELPLSAGQQVYIQGYQSSGVTDGVGNNATSTYFCISRLSGPAVVAATESVNAKYYVTDATTSPLAANPINFNGKLYDSHNAVTTGNSWKYTAPVSGKYHISVVSVPNNILGSSVYINGSIDSGIMPHHNGEFSTGSTTVPLNAGDYVDIRPSGNTTFSGGPVPYYTHISIERVGN
jgi:C1q domain